MKQKNKPYFDVTIQLYCTHWYVASIQFNVKQMIVIYEDIKLGIFYITIFLTSSARQNPPFLLA